MTDLNKLLYVAEAIYGKNRVCMWGDEIYVNPREDASMGKDNLYQPHKPTERGKAQLMDIVFALLEEGCSFNVWEKKDGKCGAYIDTIEEHYSKGKTKAEAIINLASEVLE